VADAQVRPIRIALIGAGTVGSKVASLLFKDDQPWLMLKFVLFELH